MNNKSTTLRQASEAKYEMARRNLLAVIILLVANVVMLFFGSTTMMLFSATVPYYIALVGYVLGIRTFMIIGAVIAAFIILVYFLCWIFSKKHYGWMLAALVLFILDTLFLGYLYIFVIGDVSGILDVVIHALVLYYLVIGVINGKRLKTLPPESPETQSENAGNSEFHDTSFSENSSPIRMAEDTKHRVFLECDELGHNICYRRVGKVNELVIDGYVYAEIEMLLETPHELCARIGGHNFAAGFRANSFCYLSVDGNDVKKKLRWF